jgi:DNA replication and repair protein RecF
MHLKHITLQNFRSYTKSNFTFDPRLTIIVGPNASGKSNLVEAIGMLSLGKSFRTSKEKQLIAFGKSVTHIKGNVSENEDDEQIEITVSLNPQEVLQKRYLINGISKRRSALSGRLPTVLFTPLDLAIVSGQPGDKRRYLDEVLEQTDPDYATALQVYTKALRQRNALLELAQKQGRRDGERFLYWDELLITNGQIITGKREKFIAYINQQPKKLFPFDIVYDKSLMSKERLLQYKDAEVGAGVTLVGPQRDDVLIQTEHPVSKDVEDVKYFCSRGQQRLITLELKNTQLSYLQKELGAQPILVLDDIFSELDSEHIEQVLHMMNAFQTIITTTHKAFINPHVAHNTAVIELENNNG